MQVGVHGVSDGQALGGQLLHHAANRQHAVLEAAHNAVRELLGLLSFNETSLAYQASQSIRRSSVQHGLLVRLNLLLHCGRDGAHRIADREAAVYSTLIPIARSR